MGEKIGGQPEVATVYGGFLCNQKHFAFRISKLIQVVVCSDSDSSLWDKSIFSLRNSLISAL